MNEKEPGETSKIEASEGPFEFAWFCQEDGEPIRTVADVVVTLGKSAMKSTRAELFGVCLQERDEQGKQIVVCYTGNGPRSEANAQLIAALLNDYRTTPAAASGLTPREESHERPVEVSGNDEAVGTIPTESRASADAEHTVAEAAELSRLWNENRCGDPVCEGERFSAAQSVINGAATHSEVADAVSAFLQQASLAAAPPLSLTPPADPLQGLRDAKYLNPRCASDGCQWLRAEAAPALSLTGPGTPAARLDWFAGELAKRWTDPEPLSAQAFEPRFLAWLDGIMAAPASFGLRELVEQAQELYTMALGTEAVELYEPIRKLGAALRATTEAEDK